MDTFVHCGFVLGTSSYGCFGSSLPYKDFVAGSALINTQLQLGVVDAAISVNCFNSLPACPICTIALTVFAAMPLHSYSRAWLHLVWATLERRPLLSNPTAAKISAYLSQYASEKGIYMKINFVNPDHVHALVDLPANLTIEDMMQLFKGSSSHWINQSDLLRGKFAWGRGYGAFSVSHLESTKSPITSPARRSIMQNEVTQKNSELS
jgi:putative transposase